jgi:hypothetical protein
MASLLIGLAMGLVGQAEAAVTVKSVGYTQANGVTVTYFTHVFATRTDTILANVVIGGKTVTPAIPFCLYIGTSRGATDSALSISVRWEHSPDGVNWQSSTIGTDSTTWFTPTTTVITGVLYYNSYNYKIQAFPINGTNGITGYHPYNRVVIMGRTANTVGTRVKVWWGVQ